MRWTVESLPWDQFNPEKVNPGLLAYVKAASLVEANAGDYVKYLSNIFRDDPAMHEDIIAWGEEELQHGRALRAWAERVDPTFDYDTAIEKFRQAYHFPTHLNESVRGSQALELVARCVVETGTSSFYTALRDSSEEPVFREICRRIAGDEVRHYNLFFNHFRARYSRRVSRWERARVVLERSYEVTDEELCFAYAAANYKSVDPKLLPLYAKQYFQFMANIFGPKHLQMAMGMMTRAAGLPLHDRLVKGLGTCLHRFMRLRLRFT